MNKEQLLKKLNNLIAEFTNPAFVGDADRLKAWRSSLERAMIKESLKEHAGVKMILDKLREDLVKMTEVLQKADSEILPDKKRDRLLDKKELYLWFLGFFADIDEETAEIEKKVVEETEYFEENKENYS